MDTITTTYQETITIQNNKAKRILELCKSFGIEIYDSYNKKYRNKKTKSDAEQVNEYLVEYYRWSNLTKGHLKDIFLTPRILLEFDKKDVFVTTMQLNIQSHLEAVLAHQLYFIELIINEIKHYKYVDKQELTDKQNVFQKFFIGPPKIKNN